MNESSIARASVLLFCFLANLATLFLVDDHMRIYAAALFGAAQTIGILVWSRRYNPLDVYVLTMLLWSAQFPVCATLLAVFDIPIQYGVTLESIGRATQLANIAQLIVALVWRMPGLESLSRRIPRPRLGSIMNNARALAAIWVLSVAYRLGMSLLGGQAGYEVGGAAMDVRTNLLYVLGNVASLVPLLAFTAILKNTEVQGGRLIAALIFLLEMVIVVVLSGSKSGPIVLAFNFLVGVHYVVKKISSRSVYCFLIVSLMAVIPFYAVKSRVRQGAIAYSTEGSGSVGVSDYIWLHTEALKDSFDGSLFELLSETSKALVHRMDVVTTLAATMQHYQDQEHDTRMYMMLWVKPYIPRFLWEDKGWVGLGTFVSSEILGIPTYTHAAVNSTIEGYIAGGVLGACVLAIIQGAFAGFLVNYLSLRRLREDDEQYIALLAGAFLVILYFNMSYIIIRQIVTYVFFMWLVLWIVRFFARSSR